MTEWTTIDDIDYSTGKYQVMPSPEEEEYSGLKASIRENGIDEAEPVVIDEDGYVLEGHNTAKASDELGVDEIPVVRKTGMSEDEKEDYAYQRNMARRHLEKGAKREITKQYLLKDRVSADTPQKEIAEFLSVDDSTVSRAKSELADEGVEKFAGANLSTSDKKEIARETLGENPDISTSELAEESDLSRPTARKVRDEVESEKESESQTGLHPRNDPPSIDEAGNITNLMESLDTNLNSDLWPLLIVARDEGYISKIDLRQLWSENPASVTAWFLRERGLSLIDGKIFSHFDWDGEDVSDRNLNWIEKTTVHIDQINISLFEEMRDEYDDKLVESHNKHYQNSGFHGIAPNVDVAVSSDGSFRLIESQWINQIRALQENGHDAHVEICVRNVDGNSLENMIDYIIWKAEFEAKWSRDVSREQFTSGVDSIAEDTSDFGESAEYLKEIDRLEREQYQSHQERESEFEESEGSPGWLDA